MVWGFFEGCGWARGKMDFFLLLITCRLQGQTYVLIAVTPILRDEGVKRGTGVEEKVRKAGRCRVERLSCDEAPEMILGVKRRDATVEGLN